MNVGIAGAGAIGMGYAALLLENGHSPQVWSPSGKRTLALFRGTGLDLTGAISGSFHPRPCKSAEILAKNDIIVLALPAYGHRAVIDGLLPHLEARHRIIISGHLSLAALYLSKKISERKLQIPIIAWNTTALTAKAPIDPNSIRVGTLRNRVEFAVIPREKSEMALSLCTGLFGDRFSAVDDLISISLTNLNPQNHLAMALLNFTRIETGEDWLQNSFVTPSVGRLMRALDQERVAIAAAFGKQVDSLPEKLDRTLSRTFSSISEAYQAQIERGTNPPGPRSTDTRYVLEDVPFGIEPTLWLAKLAGFNAPLHMAGVGVLNAMYDRDFGSENDLLPELGQVSMRELSSLAVYGFLEPERTSTGFANHQTNPT